MSPTLYVFRYVPSGIIPFFLKSLEKLPQRQYSHRVQGGCPEHTHSAYPRGDRLRDPFCVMYGGDVRTVRVVKFVRAKSGISTAGTGVPLPDCDCFA